MIKLVASIVFMLLGAGQASAAGFFRIESVNELTNQVTQAVTIQKAAGEGKRGYGIYVENFDSHGNLTKVTTFEDEVSCKAGGPGFLRCVKEKSPIERREILFDCYDKNDAWVCDMGLTVIKLRADKQKELSRELLIKGANLVDSDF